MGSSWEARKWKGHDEGVGRVEGRVVDSWRPGPSKGPANYFSAAIQMRTLPCAPQGRGGQSRVIWRMSGTCREPGAAPVLAAGRRNGSTLQQLPSVCLRVRGRGNSRVDRGQNVEYICVQCTNSPGVAFLSQKCIRSSVASHCLEEILCFIQSRRLTLDEATSGS